MFASLRYEENTIIEAFVRFRFASVAITRRKGAASHIIDMVWLSCSPILRGEEGEILLVQMKTTSIGGAEAGGEVSTLCLCCIVKGYVVK